MTVAGTRDSDTGRKLQVQPPVRAGMFSTPSAGYRLLLVVHAGRTASSGVIS